MADEQKIQLALDYQKVVSQYESVIRKLENQKVNLGFNTEELKKLSNEVGKITKTQIKILDDGTVKKITDVNANLTHTYKMIENLKNNKLDLTVSDNSTKVQKQLYQELVNLQRQEFDVKKMMVGANSENNNLLKQQADMIKQAQNAVNKNINDHGLQNEQMKNKLTRERINLEVRLNQVRNSYQTKKDNEANKLKEEEKATKSLIESNKKLLQSKLQNAKTRYGIDLDIKETNRLKKAINELNGANTKQVRQEIQKIKADMAQLESQARAKSQGTQVMSFGEHLRTAATTMAGYISTFTAFNTVKTLISNVVSSIRELDDVMIDVQKVTNETGLAYDNFVEKMDRVAVRLGTQTTKLAEAAAMWAKTGQSLSDAGKLAETTILGSQVGDVSVKEMQSYLVSPMKAYKMEAEDTIQIVDKLNKLSNETATDIQNLGEGLNRSSNGMALAGNSLDETLTLLDVALAKTQVSGETIGVALKTISLRLSAMRDEDGKIIPKLGEDLKAAGVNATDANGQIRSTYDILYDLSKVFNDLDKNSQLALTEKIGGKHHANIVAAILSDYKELDRVLEKSKDSTGSAMQEHERYQQSIQYQIDITKQKMDEFYRSLSSDDAIKSLVSSFGNGLGFIAGFIEKFGALNSIIGVVTFSLVAFNSKLRATMTEKNIFGIGSITKSFEGLNKTIKNQQVALQISADAMKYSGQSTAMLTVKQTALKGALIATKVASVALSAALSMGISMAISAAIGWVTSFVDKLVNADEHLREFNKEISESTEETKKQVKSAEDLFQKIKDTEAKMNSTNDKGERSRLQKELIDLQREMAELLPESARGYDSEGNAISANNELIERQIQLKKDKALLDAMKFSKENSNLKSDLEGYKKQYEAYQKLNEAFIKGEKIKKERPAYIENGTVINTIEEVTVKEKELNKAREALLAVEEGALSARVQFQALQEMGFSNDFIEEKLGISIDLLKNYDQGLRDATNSTEGIQAPTDGAANSVEEFGIVIEGFTYKANDAADAIDTLSDSFGNSNSKIELARKALKDFKEDGSLSAETIERIFSTKDTSLIAMLGDTTTLQQNLNKYIKEEEKLREEIKEKAINYAMAAEAEKKAKEEAEQGKTVAAQGGSAERDGLAQEETNKNKEAYDQDVANKQTAEDQKKQVASQSGTNANAQQEVANNKALNDQDVANKQAAEGQKTAATQTESDKRKGILENEQAALSNPDVQAKIAAEQAKTTAVQTAMANNLTALQTASSQSAAIYAKDAEDYKNKQNDKVTATTASMTNIGSIIQGGMSGLSVYYNSNVANFRSSLSSMEGSARTTASNINSILASIKAPSMPSVSSSSGGGQGKQSRIIEPMAASALPMVASINDAPKTPRDMMPIPVMTRGGEDININMNAPVTMPEVEPTPEEIQKEKVENPKLVAKDIGKEVATRTVKEFSRAMPGVAPAMARAVVPVKKPNYVSIDKASSSSSKKTSTTKKKTTSTKKTSNSSKTSKSKSSSSSSSKEKVDIKDIDDKIDRYIHLEDALNKVNNALEMNEALREHESSKDKYKYHYEEIKLLEQKKTAIYNLQKGYKSEISELEKKLKAEGIDRNNAKSKLDQMEKQVNAMANTNKAKEAAIEKYKDLKKATERYFALTGSELPKLEKEWHDVNNEIKNAQIQMEKDASKEVEDVRDKLVDALKNKYEQMREQDLSDLDKEIKVLEERLKALDKEADNKQERLAKLQAERAKWEKDDSVYGKAKVEELNEQIKELQREIEKDAIQESIDKIEAEKDKVNEHFDEILSDKNIYNEANNLLAGKSQEELLGILAEYAPDYAYIGELWGKSFKDEFKKQLQEAKDALDFLQGKVNKNEKPSTPSTPKPSTPSPAPSTPKPTNTNVGKGDRVKVTDKNAAIYYSSDSKKSSGNWGKTMQLTGVTAFKIANISGNRVALSPNGKFPATGWIDKKYIAKFKKGGLTGKWNDMNGTLGRLAELHSGEAILNKDQAKLFYDKNLWGAFENMVDMLPKFINLPQNSTIEENNPKIIINNTIHIGKDANNFDIRRKVDTLTNEIVKEMKRQGINKRIR